MRRARPASSARLDSAYLSDGLLAALALGAPSWSLLNFVLSRGRHGESPCSRSWRQRSNGGGCGGDGGGGGGAWGRALLPSQAPDRHRQQLGAGSDRLSALQAARQGSGHTCLPGPALTFRGLGACLWGEAAGQAGGQSTQAARPTLESSWSAALMSEARQTLSSEWAGVAAERTAAGKAAAAHEARRLRHGAACTVRTTIMFQLDSSTEDAAPWASQLLPLGYRPLPGIAAAAGWCTHHGGLLRQALAPPRQRCVYSSRCCGPYSGL